LPVVDGVPVGVGWRPFHGTRQPAQDFWRTAVA
jgi:hypothetical protein